MDVVQRLIEFPDFRAPLGYFIRSCVSGISNDRNWWKEKVDNSSVIEARCKIWVIRKMNLWFIETCNNELYGLIFVIRPWKNQFFLANRIRHNPNLISNDFHLSKLKKRLKRKYYFMWWRSKICPQEIILRLFYERI